MAPVENILDPNVLALSAIAAVDVGFLLKNDPERILWRIYLWTLLAVNILYGAFGPFGYLFGMFGLWIVIWVYFVTFQKRQYTLRDLLLYIILLGCMASMIATTSRKQSGDWQPATRR